MGIVRTAQHRSSLNTSACHSPRRDHHEAQAPTRPADDAGRPTCPKVYIRPSGRIPFTSRALCAAWKLRGDPKLLERDGEFEYHIKHTSELHERIAKESELHEVGR
jgi:hypothetical protein